MDYIGIFLTALACIGGYIVYYRHDKMLKEQEARLNEQQDQLNQLEGTIKKQQIQINDDAIKKIDAEKQARLEVQESSHQGWGICVTNKGKVKATNVKPRIEGFRYRNQFPNDLPEMRDIVVGRSETWHFEKINRRESPRDIFVIVTWSDEFKENNEKEFKLS